MVLTDEPPLYRDLMRLKPDELTPNAWAVKAGVSRTVWTDMRRHGNPSRRTLEKLLEAAGSSLAEFEALRIGEIPRAAATSPGQLGDFRAGNWPAAPVSAVPLFESAPGGDWPGGDQLIEMTEIDFEQTIGKVARPASLAADREAYAVTMIGNSMWPRFRPGRQLIVSPAAPVAVGDDVLVKLAGEESAMSKVLIKELVRRTAGYVELRQFNPETTFKVEASAIAAMHRVVGEAI